MSAGRLHGRPCAEHPEPRLVVRPMRLCCLASVENDEPTATVVCDHVSRGHDLVRDVLEVQIGSALGLDIDVVLESHRDEAYPVERIPCGASG